MYITDDINVAHSLERILINFHNPETNKRFLNLLEGDEKLMYEIHLNKIDKLELQKRKRKRRNPKLLK